MAYTAVPTQDTGDPWTREKHNTYVVENFNYTLPALTTAKGDLIVGAGADTWAIITPGSNYSFLMALSTESGGVLGQNWPAFGAQHDTGSNQSFESSASWTKITIIDDEYFDHASAYDGNKFTAPVTAYYIVIAFASIVNTGYYDGVENAGFNIAIYKNGALFSQVTSHIESDTSDQQYTTMGADIVQLDKDEYIEPYGLTSNTNGARLERGSYQNPQLFVAPVVL